MGPVTAIDRPVGLSDPLETRVVDAMLECIGRWGLGKTTADDVARTAGISRATLYRTFPGGMDVVFDARDPPRDGPLLPDDHGPARRRG